MRSPVAGDLCILQSLQRVLRTEREAGAPCFPFFSTLVGTNGTNGTRWINTINQRIDLLGNNMFNWDIICDKIMSDYVRIKFDFSNYAENNGLFVGNPGNWELPKWSLTASLPTTSRPLRKLRSQNLATWTMCSSIWSQTRTKCINKASQHGNILAAKWINMNVVMW